MIDARSAVVGVLEIIGYKSDKEQFANRFLMLAEANALTESIKQLPEDRRTPLVHLVNATHRKQELITVLKRYISTEVYLRCLEESINDLFLDYLTSLDRSLDRETMSKVQEYLANLTLQKG